METRPAVQHNVDRRVKMQIHRYIKQDKTSGDNLLLRQVPLDLRNMPPLQFHSLSMSFSATVVLMLSDKCCGRKQHLSRSPVLHSNRGSSERKSGRRRTTTCKRQGTAMVFNGTQSHRHANRQAAQTPTD